MLQNDNNSDIVSSDSEHLILVNENDEETGTLSKRDCHVDGGILHRAFSIFILNNTGDVLLQQRSKQKMLWPGFWSNACCSHPRAGETDAEAVYRRLEQELGIKTELSFLYKFVYRAEFANVGVEHEMCSVWVGRAESDQVSTNLNEISDWRFFTQKELESELTQSADNYTPWMKMEWQRLNEDHSEQLLQVSF